jgi:2'-5' RNA ligase
VRVFIASFLTAESARKLAADVPAIDGMRPVPEENLHMTLHFIGEVREPDSAEICALVADLEGTRLAAQVEGIVGFPNAMSARAVAARLEVPERVYAWQRTLVDLWPVAEQPGLSRKAFLPHVTFGRSRRGVSVQDQDLAGIRLELDAPAAYRSETLPEGSRYTRLDSGAD